MKKLVFLAFACFAMEFASCGNKTEAVAAETVDTTVVDTLAADTLAVDSIVAE